MSDLAECVETIEQSRMDEPAHTRTYEERLRIAKRIVRDMHAVGIDCELASRSYASERLTGSEIGQTCSSVLRGSTSAGWSDRGRCRRVGGEWIGLAGHRRPVAQGPDGCSLSATRLNVSASGQHEASAMRMRLAVSMTRPAIFSRRRRIVANSVCCAADSSSGSRRAGRAAASRRRCAG